MGTASLRGLKLASDEINHSGGILGRAVVLHVEDSFEGKGSQYAVAGQDP